MENEARADNPEQAIIQDLALREAYAGHPAHYIISNERGISFEDKVNNAVDTVMQITGVPGHRTHYKTFLLKKNAQGQYLFDSKVKLNESRYETTLVEASEEYMQWVHCRGSGESSYYELETRFRSDGGQMLNTHRRVSYRDYMEALRSVHRKRSSHKTVVKKRVSFIDDK